MSRQTWNRLELAVGMFFLLFCLLVSLTQFVNPFPHDGWFESQHRLFIRHPGGDNYTPIAAPAFFYALVHAMSAAAGWDLETEFYLGSLLHHILLFLTGVFIYLSHRCLGLLKSGLAASALVIVLVESTLLPQSFLSENIVLCLMSAVIYIGINLLVKPELGEGEFSALTLIFGILMGALIVTRAIPFLLLPGALILFWLRLPKGRAIRFALFASMVVSFTVLAQMSANHLRFGRFELSNSVGRHLWDVISPRADEMLANSPEYQLLRSAGVDAQGKLWWNVDNTGIAGLENLTREDFLRTLSFQAISQHPAAFVELGLSNTLKMLSMPPGREGLGRAEYYNPLNRNSLLPAYAYPSPLVEKALTGIYLGITRTYSFIIYGTLALGGIAFVLGAAIFRRSGGDRPALIRQVWWFSTLVFLACLYASCQLERPVGRYVIPYLPLLALMVSTAVGMLTDSHRREIAMYPGRVHPGKLE